MKAHYALLIDDGDKKRDYFSEDILTISNVKVYKIFIIIDITKYIV